MPSQSHSEQQSSTEHQLRQELMLQARFLDGLVQSLGSVSAGLDSVAVLERTAHEEKRLFTADAVLLLVPAAGVRTSAASAENRRCASCAVCSSTTAASRPAETAPRLWTSASRKRA
jgi:hypothetical protein